jgi:hypothetical protein
LITITPFCVGESLQMVVTGTRKYDEGAGVETVVPDMLPVTAKEKRWNS